jgi:hypothetical protein
MSAIYTIEHHSSRRNTIRVHFLDEGWAQVNDYNHWIQETIDEMVLWCDQHKCGERTAYDMFRFASKKELTMFLLRWDK